MSGRFIKSVLEVIAKLGLIIVLFCCATSSQNNRGRIVGTVTEQTGAVISGATVTVVDIQRGTVRVSTADQTGEYDVRNLLPGTYSIRTQAQGFKTAEHARINLKANQELRVDLTLLPGEQSEKMTASWFSRVWGVLAAWITGIGLLWAAADRFDLMVGPEAKKKTAHLLLTYDVSQPLQLVSQTSSHLFDVVFGQFLQLDSL